MPLQTNCKGTLLERFAKYVSVQDDCWIWLGSKTGSGYGKFRVCQKTVLAHRFSYEIHRSILPKGKAMQLDHLCKVKHCVNPWHMELVTARTNTLRSENPASINAKKTHCLRGHELDEKNLYRRKDRPNDRVCKVCKKIRAVEWYEASKA